MEVANANWDDMEEIALLRKLQVLEKVGEVCFLLDPFLMVPKYSHAPQMAVSMQYPILVFVLADLCLAQLLVTEPALQRLGSVFSAWGERLFFAYVLQQQQQALQQQQHQQQALQQQQQALQQQHQHQHQQQQSQQSL